MVSVAKLRLIFMMASIYTYDDQAEWKRLCFSIFFSSSFIEYQIEPKTAQKDTTKPIERNTNICCRSRRRRRQCEYVSSGGTHIR